MVNSLFGGDICQIKAILSLFFFLQSFINLQIPDIFIALTILNCSIFLLLIYTALESSHLNPLLYINLIIALTVAK